MARFFLIRHGDKQQEDIMVGRAPDVHLTKNGHAQARRLAAHFRRVRIDAIYSSPMDRAVETIAPLARSKKMRTQTAAAFDEIDMGQWTGRSKTAVKRMPAWRRFSRCSAEACIPSGETLAEAQARIVSGMIRFSEGARSATIVAATHEDLIRLAVCYFIGAPIEAYEHITIRTGSYTLLTLNHEGAILELLDALPAEDPRLLPS